MDNVQNANNCTNIIEYYSAVPLVGTCYTVWNEAGFSYTCVRSEDVA
jgi:hypothetical protein